jgi:hypothetical protein
MYAEEDSDYEEYRPLVDFPIPILHSVAAPLPHLWGRAIEVPRYPKNDSILQIRGYLPPRPGG